MKHRPRKDKFLPAGSQTHCQICGIEFILSNYHSKALDHRCWKCRNRKYHNASAYRRKFYREYYSRRPDGFRKYRYAISTGIITSKPCEMCGNEKSEAHHNDYRKPMEVRWLCRKCHTIEHQNLRKNHVPLPGVVIVEN
jgi:hypothetical protein